MGSICCLSISDKAEIWPLVKLPCGCPGWWCAECRANTVKSAAERRDVEVKTCTGEGAKDHAWPAFFLQNYVDAQVVSLLTQRGLDAAIANQEYIRCPNLECQELFFDDGGLQAHERVCRTCRTAIPVIREEEEVQLPKTVKKCPECSALIERVRGTCNKMVCASCRTHFCFKCLTRHTPENRNACRCAGNDHGFRDPDTGRVYLVPTK